MALTALAQPKLQYPQTPYGAPVTLIGNFQYSFFGNDGPLFCFRTAAATCVRLFHGETIGARRWPMLDRPRAFLLLILLLLSLSLTFCAKKEAASAPTPAANPPAASTTSSADSAAQSTAAPPPTAAAAAPPAASGIATAEGDAPGVTVSIKELKRGSGGTVSLKIVITNGSDKGLGFGYNFADPDHEIRDHGSVGGVHLIDPVGKKKYFVARDAEGKCVCSQGMKDVAPGASVNAWAKFPAPPDDVQKISVIIPHFSPMDDVPISR